MDLTPDEQRAFDELADRAKGLTRGDYELDEPPPDVWDRIEGELAEGPEVVAPPGRFAQGPSRAARWLVAAAAVIVIALGAWAVLTVAEDDAGTVVASAELDSLDDDPTRVGRAELVDVDGQLRLEVEAGDLSAGADDFLELWVIDPDVTELVSLGPLRSDGSYDLPPSIDPERFPVVDISREPLNGDPTHSGDSLARGQLQFS